MNTTLDLQTLCDEISEYKYLAKPTFADWEWLPCKISTGIIDLNPNFYNFPIEYFYPEKMDLVPNNEKPFAVVDDNNIIHLHLSPRAEWLLKGKSDETTI
jgi:hypothetical protein